MSAMHTGPSILITGGAGFIGRRLTHYLVNRGARVIVADLQLDQRKAELAPFADVVEYVEGDVKDEKCLFSLVKDRSCVVHLAAGASFLMYEERPVYETVNVMHGFLNVLEAVRFYKVSKLVYASTSAVYEGNTTPYHEGMDLRPAF
jgi:nucleoside-diphosphate-sugar epimerase